MRADLVDFLLDNDVLIPFLSVKDWNQVLIVNKSCREKRQVIWKKEFYKSRQGDPCLFNLNGEILHKLLPPSKNNIVSTLCQFSEHSKNIIYCYDLNSMYSHISSNNDISKWTSVMLNLCFYKHKSKWCLLKEYFGIIGKPWLDFYFCFKNNNHWKLLHNVFYFEVVILKEPMHEDKVFIIGFSSKDSFWTNVFDVSLLGWCENSIGYHSDDGNIFYGHKFISNSIYGRGDTIGCGMNDQTIFFTKNGRLIYTFHLTKKLCIYNLFPVLQFNSSYTIEINLGHQDFLYTF